jgi:3-hydroxy-9,10-secoandrosta-1,3,5(10)-triene-9,17-dione monooxygenase reductase component
VPEPSPALDRRSFRQTVGQFVTGVTVIVTELDGHIRGMTANSFASLSLDPPLVLFCVGKHTKTGQLIRSATGFSVNILRYGQEALSTYFAGGWNEPAPPPFSFVNWVNGGPRLDGCAAAIGCAIDTIHEGGDHWIVVGRVLDLFQFEGPHEPLVFVGGRYTTVRAAPQPDTPDLTYLISGF